MSLSEKYHISGLLVGDHHELQVRVYYEDTDFAGVVYHANYLRYFERARTDFLRLRGVDQVRLFEGVSGEPLTFAVAKMALTFSAPARMDDIVLVRTAIERLCGARIVLAQQAMRGPDPLCTGQVEVALIGAGGRPRRLPDDVRRVLEPG